MRHVTYAQLPDLDSLVQIDYQVIGNESRREEILQYIQQKRCLVVKEDKKYTGFLLFHTHFFDHTFVSLLIIDPEHRRKGYGSSLLNHVETISQTEKIFSSTNQSNQEMQRVFEVNGYAKSGLIENLDFGDSEIVYFKRKEK